MHGSLLKLTKQGDGALSSERLKKYALTGSVTCAGQKQPLAPNSAVKPCVQQEQKNKNYEKKKENSIYGQKS